MEKKTELEMEASNVAKMNDSRRILDLRRDVGNWKTSTTVTHQCSALVNCATQSHAHALHQPDSTGINMGFKRKAPMTENIQNSTGVMTRSSVKSMSCPSISVISNVDNIRGRFAGTAQKSQDIDRVVEDSLDEGKEMGADVAKKRSTPIRLVTQAKKMKRRNTSKR